MRFLQALVLLFLASCSDVRKTSLVPSAKSENPQLEKLLERKVQSSRKAEIIQGKSTAIIAIATYLNDVDNVQAARELFLIELYEKTPSPDIKNKLKSQLISGGKSTDSLFITKLTPSQYTEILYPSNPYNTLFIIEFLRISAKHRETMRLKLDIENLGSMDFNFGYPTLNSKLQ
ncbi:MAG: hypothetical protein MR629_05780 [Helicobacter sp.]|nr:hypothetical protein [Helicobacter sp.]MCI7485170.1 hypothetical protein [Helicobacter sp.]MDD7567992.1 hypothetical protein [Helicobacter sp.]MDY5740323.1 hypothetical protein [Helicobacter sp.]